ncbi:MAG TPA: hypothetical protein VI298_15510 [Geobacteraceae bacterium]
MKSVSVATVRILVISLLVLALPALSHAQSGQAKSNAPPVGQPLVSEGTFAAKLEFALGLGTGEDEVEAESRLGEAGIAPRNGWIADYPVTPDIVAEVQAAVEGAAAAGNMSLPRDEALKRFAGVAAGLGLSIKPYTAAQPYQPTAASCEGYPNPAVVNNVYTGEGPPVVTYYCPPPDYYYLYAWVPCPFWWADFWFPGFFILRDFHKIVIVNNRVVIITNHFNDLRTHRMFRVDPSARFSGKTFAGIGVTRPRDFIQTGVPRSAERIFNGPRAGRMPAGRTFAPSPRGGEAVRPPADGRTIAPPSGGGMIAPPPRGGGTRR